MTTLTEDEAIKEYVDKKDVKEYIARRKDLSARLQRLKKTNLPKYQANIRKIKKAILQAKLKDETGERISVLGSTVEWQVIYGRARVGGALTFAHVSTDNSVLHLFITFAAHEIEAVEKLFLDGEEVIFGATPDPRWSTGIKKKDNSIVPADHKVFMSVSSGTTSQAVNGDLNTQLPSLWTTSHRQRGRAGAYLILVWDELLFPDGLPAIEFQVKGKKVYDPRTTLTTWSENAALITADYLMDTTFGMGIPQAKVDMTALTAAANSCDVSMPLLSGGTEARWRINGSIKASDSPQNILETLAAHFAGNIIFANGLWKILAPEFRASVLTLDEDDILGDVRVSTGASRKDIFNRVRGTFTDAAGGYKEADFPPVKNDYYKSLDNNEEIWEDIQLPLCVSASQAQRVAKVELERTRAGVTASFLAKLSAFKAEAGETISITNSRFGWTAKTFEVEECQLVIENDAQGNPFLAVQITAKETSAGVYDLSQYETSYDITPNTNLPNPFVVGAPSGLTLSSGTAELLLLPNGTIITRIKVSWTSPGDSFVTSGGQIHIQYKKSADVDWIDVTPVPGNSTFSYVSDVIDGQLYDVRIRAKNAAGVFSSYVTQINYLVIGKTQPPGTVQGFRGAILGYGIQLNWDPLPEPDIAEYELRTGSATEAWESANLLARTRTTSFLAELRLSGNYRFFLKAIDSSGNYSTTASILAVNVPVPSAPVTTISLENEDLIFNWVEPTSTFAISQYEITFGIVTETNPTPSYENSVFLASVKGTSLRSRINWAGTRYFWIAARDVAGNLGTPFQLTMTINAPSIATLRGDVVDNNVLLYWTEQRGTLPIARYYVHKGAEYQTAELRGQVSGTFIALFETAAGVYTYWVTPEDTARNKGAAAPIVLRVSQPPDFVLRLNRTIDPREAQIATNIFIEGFGFAGGAVGGGGGGVGSPIGMLLTITNPTPPIGGPGGIGSPVGALLSITRAS